VRFLTGVCLLVKFGKWHPTGCGWLSSQAAARQVLMDLAPWSMLASHLGATLD
jgi:hypothetical protein